MDIRSLIHTIQQYYKNFKAKVSETLKLPFAKSYILLSVVLTIFFIIVTFPYEILIRNQIVKLEPVIGSSINLGKLDFSLFNDSYIDELSLGSREGAETFLKNITINIAINPVTTLVKKTISGMLSIQNFTYTNRDLTIRSLVMSDFDIRFDSATGLPKDGYIDIKCDNVYVKGAKIKGFSIPPVRFTSIQSKAKFINGNLSLESLKFNGSDLNGSMNGTIELNKFIKTSRMNLTIIINAESRILEDYKLLLSGFVDEGSKQIKIILTGRISRPRIQMPSISTPRPPEQENDQ
ncbi:MAG TPA: type II secretion system protein GspN [Spirochaetota bacterium]|nr:type II secretion system protein GspN [Spirochaetota bacterium]